MEGNAFLSENARRAIEDEENVKYISIASLWEIAVKISLGKLKLKKKFDSFLYDLSQTNIKILPITISHIIRVSTLEFIHRDPFDRLIICQSLEENFNIIGKDQHFSRYNVGLFW
jgi:PIN domain nuclease of toxin-antitoxin system